MRNMNYSVSANMDGMHYGNLSEMDYTNGDFLYDYSQMDYPGQMKVIPHWQSVIKIAVYVVIMITAIIGNVLIIVVVARNKRMRTTTNFYIVNLAVSDLLVTGFCTWVRLVDDLTEGWVLGTFFCKVNTFAQVVSLVASIFSLTLIACDRFFGIVFAMKAHIIERKASHSIVILWVCSVAVAAPMLVVRELNTLVWRNHVEIWCDDNWPIVVATEPATGREYNTFPARKAYYTILTVVLYFLPMFLMSCVYFIIIVTVWFSRSPGERMTKEVKLQGRVKRKVVIMLVLILTTFGICWLPLQITVLYSEYKGLTTQLEDWYYTLTFIAYTLAFSNSALNPIIYAGFNENFRNGLLVSVPRKACTVNEQLVLSYIPYLFSLRGVTGVLKCLYVYIYETRSAVVDYIVQETKLEC